MSQPSSPRGPATLGCVFCNIIASVDFAIAGGGDPPAARTRRLHSAPGRDLFRLFKLLSPYSSGHLMIVPYRHLDSLAVLQAPEAVELITLAQRAESSLRTLYRPDGTELRPKSRRSSRRRGGKSPPPTRPAPMERRHQLHDGHGRDRAYCPKLWRTPGRAFERRFL